MGAGEVGEEAGTGLGLYNLYKNLRAVNSAETSTVSMQICMLWWRYRTIMVLLFSFFSSGGHFVLAILVEGHPRNISGKLFQNPMTRLGGDVSLVNC